MRLRTRLRHRTLVVLPLLLFLSVSYYFFHSYFDGYQVRLSSARADYSAWNLIRAEESLESLVADFPDSGGVRMLYAECLLRRGELKKARRQLVGLDNGESDRFPGQILLATTHFFMGHHDSASAIADRIIREASSGGDSLALARAYHLLGRIGFDRARYDSALMFQRRSLACARAAGSSQAEADALRQLGVLYWYSGKNDSALTMYYTPALNLYRKLGDRGGEATTLNNIGLLDGGSRNLLDAFYIRKQIGDQIGLADSYYFVTSPVAGGHWNNLAYSFRLKSLKLSSEIGYAWGREVAARAVDQMMFWTHDSLSVQIAAADSVTRSGEGMILLLQLKSSELMRRGNWDEAVRFRERVVFLCDSLGYTHGLATALEQYADALVRQGDFRTAEQVAYRSLQVTGSDLLPRGWLLAKVYLAEGRNKEAFGILSSLLREYDTEHIIGLRDHNPLRAENTGMILSRRYVLYNTLMNSLGPGDSEHALEFLERFRALMTGVGLQHGGRKLAVGQESLWHRYNRLLETIDRGEDAGDLMDEFDEEYQQAELKQSLSADASRTLYRRSIPTVRNIQDFLEPGQLFIEYFMGIEHGYALAISRHRSSFLRLGENVRALNSSSQAVHELILRGKNSPGDTLWRQPASFLFSSLIKPLRDEGMFNDIDHLIVSPHGLIHHIPFTALLGEEGRPLVERLAVSYTRSGADLREKTNQPPPFSVLGLLPDDRSLPHASSEIGSIPEKISRSTTILRDEQATPDRFLKLAQEADIVHIAAHGRMDRAHPLFSRLDLAAGPLELHMILNLELKARIVVVSACETGYAVGMHGDLGHGHEVVSFPYAFLAAGAAAVLSPSWIVEDEATSRLFGMFYANLSDAMSMDGMMPSGSEARALAGAQRQFLREATANGYRNHPFYWAGFYLIGNPN